MMESIGNFFIENFYNAWIYETGYNIYTTMLNVVLFLVVAYIFYYVVEKKNVVISDSFLYGSMAWSILGVSIRLMEDLGMVKSIFLITPFIYIEVLFVAALSLYVLLKYKPVIKTHKYTLTYWQMWIKIPLISSIPFFWIDFIQALNKMSLNVYYFFITLWVWILSLLVIALFRKRVNVLKPVWNVKTLWFQMFDGITTFMAITFLGFSEEHVLARNLIEYMEKLNLTINGSGAWAFLVLKIFVVSFVIYVIDKYITDLKERRLIKYFIIMLGFIVGLRNLLNILLNVGF